MIGELDRFDSVKEVKRLGDDPHEHAVAIQGTESYEDPSMRLATGNITFPEQVLEMIEKNPHWEFSKLQFRTSGDYSGCFTFRIQRVDG